MSAMTAQSPMTMQVNPGAVRNPGLVILFMFITLGFYGLYWWWVTLDEVKMWRGGMGWGGPMILMILVPFAGIILIALPFLLPSWTADMHRRHGMVSNLSGAHGLLVFIPLLGGIIWLVLVQNALNDFWISKGATP
jgi:hypothetical protein